MPTSKNDLLPKSNFLLEQSRNDGIKRVAVKILIKKGNAVLMLKRSPGESVPGLYELPGGGIQEGEDIFSAGRRELHEETGLPVQKFYPNPEIIDVATVTSNEKCRIFILHTLPGEGKIILNLSEHDEYKWVSENEADDLFMFPEVRQFIKKSFI